LKIRIDEYFFEAAVGIGIVVAVVAGTVVTLVLM
jgi:hypothetical protein